MTDLQSWVAPTYQGLADLLAATAVETWDAPSLCEKWQVRHVVAHVTMPARLTPEQFGAEMAAAGGDFGVLSDTVAARDGSLPVADLLDQLRSPGLHAWQPPGGGAAGALSHAVIHSLDVTVALGRPAVAPAEAATAVLDQLTAAGGSCVRGRPDGRPARGHRHRLELGERPARSRRQRISGGAGERPHAARRPGTAARLTRPRRRSGVQPGQRR